MSKVSHHICSPELPCGTSWLANCLLELNVELANPWGIDLSECWKTTPAGETFLGHHPVLKQTLPALIPNRTFQFVPQPTPVLSHLRRDQVDPSAPVLIFTRDPRDALYSQWRRLRGNSMIPTEMSFVSFVASPFLDGKQSWLDYLHRFWSGWLDNQPTPCILRFEDYKSYPEQTLNNALDFLDFAPPTSARQVALNASSFAVFQSQEQALAAQGKLQYKLNHASIAFEHRTHFNTAMYSAIGTRFDEICTQLGYETSVISSAL